MSTLGRNLGFVGENLEINSRHKIFQEEIVEFIRQVRHHKQELFSGEIGTIDVVD